MKQVEQRDLVLPGPLREEVRMNGADSLCDTLLANEVNVCFANPGTSEMHFVSALDRKPEMRCILGLFEGVVTGAADGYARMTQRPAATLLHLGPGLANGLANMHNAQLAQPAMSPAVPGEDDADREHPSTSRPSIKAARNARRNSAPACVIFRSTCRGAPSCTRRTADAAARPAAVASFANLPSSSSVGSLNVTFMFERQPFAAWPLKNPVRSISA